MSGKDLIQLIKDNPQAVFEIDNDYWVMYQSDPSTWPDECTDEWMESQEIARSGEVIELGDGGYGSGNCYGGDILQALAKIVGVNIRSV